MFTEQQADKIISVLQRIADSLETISSVVDDEESEFNVYARVEDEDENDDEDEDEEFEDEETRAEEEVY